jgi:hypothetical protein
MKKGTVIKLFSLIGFLMSSVALSASEQPKSTIYGNRSDQTDKRNFDIVFISIDNKNQYQKQRATLEPGTHLFEMASAKSSRSGLITSQRLLLEIKPCTSYYFSAQHSKKKRGKYWTLKQREVAIEGCTYKAKAKLFDHTKDPRTDQYQAEIHALAMRNFIFNKMDACPKLKNNEKLIQWLTVNNSIVNAADLEIKAKIGVLYALKGDTLFLDYFNTFVSRLTQAENMLMKTHGEGSLCSLNLNGWTNLMELSPFNKVYKFLMEENRTAEGFIEDYNKAMEFVMTSHKSTN